MSAITQQNRDGAPRARTAVAVILAAASGVAGAFRRKGGARGSAPVVLVRAIELGLVIAIAYTTVSFFYVGTLSAPEGAASAPGAVDGAAGFDRGRAEILSRFDPFHRVQPADAPARPAIAAPQTTLDLTLQGLRYRAEGEGVAFIRLSNGEQRRFGPGDEIVAGVFLDQVLADRVILRRAGVRESLGFRDDEASAISSVSGRSARAASQAVETESPPSSILQFVELRPRVVDGRLVGYELHWTERDALFRGFGLAPGDVLREINGVAVSSGEVATEMLDELRASSEATLTVERGGEMITVDVDLSAFADRG